jgi:cell wall-associated NlpC family hydrolase
MTFRSRLAVLALVVSAPAFAGRLAQADPAAQLSAAVEAKAAASSEQAVSASIAREDVAIQRAIDRKVAARMATALGPVPVRLGSLPRSGSGETMTARTANSRRTLYAVK